MSRGTADLGVRPKVWFVGAGPGAADLLTFRAAAVIGMADIVVYAGSLVNAEVLRHAREGVEVYDSSGMTLEAVLTLYTRALAERLVVARLHSGDPSIYGATHEQIAFCEQSSLPCEIVPGVSSLGASAAVVGRELTVPEVAQSVVLTRLGGRTPMPDRETVRSFAAHGTTMAIFLSAARPGELQKELESGYPAETPCVVVVRATWPDERVLRCPLSDLARSIREAGVHKTALVLVGPALGASGTRSNLYDPEFGHEFRRPKAWLDAHPDHARPGRTATRQGNGRG
jgi:precorrin-4/cobalt-precorrin-4 C11-methyltransferase